MNRAALSILASTLPIAAASADPAAEDAPRTHIDFSATLGAESLVVGTQYSFVVSADFKQIGNASGAGIPAPILQLDVPACVKLGGRYVEGYNALSQNEFLLEPYERLVEGFPIEIPFELTAEPTPESSIGINLVAYVAPDGEDPFFLRERLELPVAPEAQSSQGDPKNSNWGPAGESLQIGDTAALFTLPWGNGATGSIETYLGESNVLVLTYRAHW